MVRHKREFGDSQGTKQLKLQKIQFKLVAQGLRSNAGVIKDLSDLNEEIWDSNECAECLRICSDVSELAAVGSSLFCNFACFAAVTCCRIHLVVELKSDVHRRRPK